MRLPVACAVWLVLGIAACDTSPSEPKTGKPSEISRTDPVRAREQSPNCPNRCGYALDVGMPNARLLSLMENATIFGASNQTPFLWHLRNGSKVLPARAPDGEGRPVVNAVSDWGQMAGFLVRSSPTGDAWAMAWEPDGTPVHVTAGAGGPRVQGHAHAINENSVIAGEGRPAGDLGPMRAFRSHYRDGFRWLTAAGTQSKAADVNFSGAVVGEYRPAESTINAFLWTPTKGFQDLGPGRAVAVSETGYVTGMRFGSPGQGFLRTPQGETVLLEPGWQPIDVNHWGEVLLQGFPAGYQTGCKIGVWYRGYGLLELSSPVADSPNCYVSSLNSWGDVAGGVFKDVPSSEYGGRTRVFTPVLWTWQGNAHRYVR